MKKLNLNAPGFVGGTLLSRSELKKLMGGGALGCAPQYMSCSIESDCCEGLTCVAGLCMVKNCRQSTCSFYQSGVGLVNGFCGNSQNGLQCRCMTLDGGASVPMDSCKA